MDGVAGDVVEGLGFLHVKGAAPDHESELDLPVGLFGTPGDHYRVVGGR